MNAFQALMGGVEAGQGFRRNEMAMEQARAEAEMRRAAMEQERQAAMMAAERQRFAEDRQRREFGVRARALGLGGQSGPIALPQPQPQGMMPKPAPGTVMQQQQAPQPQNMMDGGTVTVTGQRLPQPQRPERVSQSDLMEQLLVSAFEANDTERFNELADQWRSSISQEELQARQAIAGYATHILELPADQRVEATRYALQIAGIDPAQTNLDDISDPVALSNALALQVALGSPERAAQEAVRVRGTQQEFRRPEIIDQGNQRTVVSMSGPTAGQAIQSFEVRADPNAVLSAQTQRRGQDVQAQIAAANRRHQAAMAAANRRHQAEMERFSAGDAAGRQREQQRFQAEQNRLNREHQSSLAAIRSGVGGVGLGDIENDPMWEPVQ